MEAGSLGIGTSLISRAGPPLVVQSLAWQRDTAAALAGRGGVLAFFRSWMRLGIDFLKPLGGDVRVPLGGGDAGMTEQLLD